MSNVAEPQRGNLPIADLRTNPNKPVKHLPTLILIAAPVAVFASAPVPPEEKYEDGWK